MTSTPAQRNTLGLITFALILVAGLFYVKWSPYYHKAFLAAANHAIGNSILMGKDASPPPASLDAALAYAFAYGKAIWQAMVLGLLLGSGVQALLPANWVAKALGGTGFGSVAAGGLMGIPTMMCTCCAAPVVAGLRTQKASPGAAISFWLGNTVLNPATLVFMGFVLGWNWTVLRLVMGLILVFGLGFLANKLITPEEAQSAKIQIDQLSEANSNENMFVRWLKIFGKMAIKLIPEYIVLILLLGAARVFLFPHIGPEIGNSIFWIISFALAGALFVIPTAGEVPIIQAMLALGLGVGPAGALLMTLPPISLPSVAMVARSFKPTLLALITAAVIVIGIITGLMAIALGF